MQDKPIHDVFDEFKHQLPDIDPAETQEWVDSLDALVDAGGPERARFVLYKLLKRARSGPDPLTSASSDSIHSCVSAGSMSGSWCLNSS